jgi:hypothetical protein
METKKIIVQQALKIYLGIIAFFFVMKILGLENMVELRVLNFGFVIWGINTAVKMNISINLDNSYLGNLSLAFATAFFAVLAVTFSLIIYTLVYDSSVIGIMTNSILWGKNLSLGHVVFAILIEGMASSVICSFLIMQYWKKYKVTPSF